MHCRSACLYWPFRQFRCGLSFAVIRRMGYYMHSTSEALVWSGDTSLRWGDPTMIRPWSRDNGSASILHVVCYGRRDPYPCFPTLLLESDPSPRLPVSFRCLWSVYDHVVVKWRFDTTVGEASPEPCSHLFRRSLELHQHSVSSMSICHLLKSCGLGTTGVFLGTLTSQQSPLHDKDSLLFSPVKLTPLKSCQTKRKTCLNSVEMALCGGPIVKHTNFPSVTLYSKWNSQNNVLFCSEWVPR